MPNVKNIKGTSKDRYAIPNLREVLLIDLEF